MKERVPMPKPGDIKSRGSQEPAPTVKFRRDDIEDDIDQRAEEDLNSTMMSIDVNALNDGLTKTQIRSDSTAAEKGVHEHHAARRTSLITKLFAGGTGSGLAQRFPSFVPTWLCETDTPFLEKALFYLTRLAFVILFFVLQWIIFSQTITVFQVGHPARWFYLIGGVLQLLGVVASFLLNLSPGWVAGLPLSFLLLVFSVGAVLFSTADSVFFIVNGFPLARMLNAFVTLTLLLCVFLGGVVNGRTRLSRILLAALCLLCLVPFVLNILQNVPLEQALFGAGIFAGWGGYAWQPAVWVLEIGVPVLFILFLVFSFGTSRKKPDVDARGFARTCAFVLFFLCLCSLSLLQKNRVPHFLNFFVPLRLDVGVAEVEVSGQALRIETKQFALMGLSDDVARDRFILKKGKADGEYRLTVSDAVGFPVRNLKRSDLVVFVNDQKVNDFTFVEQPGITDDGAVYILGIKLAQSGKLITGDFSKRARTNDEVLEFKISDPSQISRLVVKEASENILNLTNLTGDTVQLPLAYFQEGNYRLALLAYDKLDQEIFKQEWEVVIQQLPRVDVLSPAEGDTVEDELSVVLLHSALETQSLQQVSYYVDDALLLQSTSFVMYQPLSLKGVGDGEHRLTIKVQSTALKEPQVTSLTFVKKTDAAQLVIDEPFMGIFAGRDMPVKFHVTGTAAKIAGVKAFVNGQVFNDFVLKDHQFILPATRWSHAELVLMLQATLDDGTKISDWTFVNKGAGTLELNFDQNKLAFLNYKAVALVLDATASLWDNWHGREKWQILKRVVSESDIDAKLKFLNTSVLVFGARKSYYYQDCEDRETLINAGEYNPSILKKKLSEIKPSGISSLWASLQEAMRDRPDKVFIFTDGADHCDEDGFAVLQKTIQKNPQTQIVVFALGQIAHEDEVPLQKLAELSRGRYYQPEDYDALLSMWLGELAPQCQIFALDQLLQQEAFENKKVSLGAGEYVFKISAAGQLKEIPFTIQNGATTTLNITGEKDDVKVEVKKGKE